mmetsp:Transcript_17145/g.20927  ORF Transcript_17145/g.20927 Transcript_17145/m.20927 type:complete len:544 (+) Transcript_17145:80-1711(+)
MRGKNKSLDDFFDKKEKGRKGKRIHTCDLSLCSATTRRDEIPSTLCTWKRNPQAFKIVPQKMGRLGGSLIRRDLLLMQVKEENVSAISETATSSLGGVTLGIAQLLYASDKDKKKQEDRNDIESIGSSELIINGSQSVTCTVSDASSFEASMSGFEITIEEKMSSVSSLGRHRKCKMKEARITEQKCRVEEKKIAEKRRLLDEEHSEFQSLLKQFRGEAERAEERRREEVAKLAERRRLLKEAYLKEQARLAEEENILAEEGRQAAETARHILVEGRFSESDSILDPSFSRTVSMGPALGVLSETTWEHDEYESCCNERDDEEEIECLGKHLWKDSEAWSFEVRGRTYLTDKRKVASAPNLFRLITVDMVEVSEPIMTGFCSHPKERVQKWLMMEKKQDKDSIMPPFVFCVNMVLPGPPHYHLVMYFAIDDFSLLGLSNNCVKHPYSSSLQKFLFGDSNEYRNKKFKLIPRLTEGSFLLKTVVGTKPFILGKYLNQSFIKGDRYLEVVADVGSSKTFQKLMTMSSSYVSYFTFVITRRQTMIY